MLIEGYLIGFTAAASLGPIALLTIQRTLKSGWRIGLASGVGVALADGLYGLAGALGIAALTGLLINYQVLLRVIGGLVLVYLGMKAALSKLPPTPADESSQPSSLLGAAAGIFLLTLSNPMTILFFSAVFAGISPGGVEVTTAFSTQPGFFAAGVFAGSLTWWMIMTAMISALRSRFRLDQLAWLNRVSGVVIAGFGVWVILSVLRGL